MSGVATIPAASSRWKLILLQLVVVYVLALRLWFDIAVTPMGDEAYYWMWGQHLSWSYFDHPPLNGWLQALVAATLGWSNVSVRALTWLTLAGTLWILWLWSARLAPDNREDWFWHSAAIYLTIPVVSIITSFAFHDHLLVFFAIASLYCFHGFAGSYEAGRPRWRQLYLSAALLGLAVLSKYNGVFLGLGYALWVLWRPTLRRLLLTPHLWLAALLAVAMQGPVLYWNLTEGMASFRFHLLERPSVNWSAPKLGQLGDFLATMALMMSPVLFLSLFRLPFLRPSTNDESRALGLSGAACLASTIGWGAIALYVYVYFHWNMVAYAALAPIALRLIGRRIALALHLAFGLLLVSGALLSYTVTPLNLFGYADRDAGGAHGWPELAARVEARQAAHPDAFLAASRYTYAAQLGFVLRNTDVAAFNPLRSQNDYWWDKAAHAGQDAIIVADSRFPIDTARLHFAGMEKLEDIAILRYGRTVWTFQIWLGTAYDGR